MSILIPPPLKEGDLIAIVPTARAITSTELQEGVALAESWGLRVRLGAGVGRKHYQQAGTDTERAADLQNAINDPEVRMIWCARGGYGTVRLMDKIDLAPLRKDPKWIVGFSDITVLHNAMLKHGVATLHAQMPFHIGAKTQSTRESVRSALFGGAYGTTSAPAASIPVQCGSAQAQFVGGNLSILYALRGTPFDIDPSGKILFLEDLDELLYHMDRMVQNLKHGGWFNDLAGLVVGGMSDMHDKNPADPFGMTAEEMLREAIGEAKYPVCFGFPAGHMEDNRALRMGQKAKLSVTPEGTTLSFDGPLPDA